MAKLSLKFRLSSDNNLKLDTMVLKDSLNFNAQIIDMYIKDIGLFYMDTYHLVKRYLNDTIKQNN